MTEFFSEKGSGSNSGDIDSKKDRYISETVGQIADVLYEWSCLDAGMDRRTIIISGAIHDAIRNMPQLTQELSFAIAVHDKMHTVKGINDTGNLQPGMRISDRILPIPFPEYGANLLHAGFRHEWRKLGGEIGWPNEFTSPEVCANAVKMVVDDPETIDSLVLNICTRPITTTVKQRIAGPKLVMLAQQDRFPRPINVVSVGHSLGLIERDLLLNSPLHHIRAMEQDRDSGLLIQDLELTDGLAKRSGERIEIKHLYGTDIFPGDIDTDAGDWAISCLKPHEHMNKNLMAEIERLRGIWPPNYSSMQGDFSMKETRDRLDQSMGGDKADVVFFSTVWYMLPQADRDAMLQNALEILSPEGIIILQDFVHIDPSEGKLVFPTKWDKWSYGTLVLDPRKSLDFSEAMRFNDGRLGAVQLSEEYESLLFKAA